MRKFFTAGALALAICAPFAPVQAAQASNTRVAPLAGENPPNGNSSAPKSEKKRGVESAPVGNEPRKESGAPGPSNKSGAAEKSANGQSRSVASSTRTVPPVESGSSNSASDAPSKSNPATIIPISGSKVGKTEAGGDGLTSKSSPPTVPAPSAAKAVAAPPAPPLTSIYRIGEGDVLDIRLLNLSDSRQSTLFTVLAGGIVEYPLLPDPLSVAGFTPEEIALQLVAELRRRGVYEKPQVRVSVRDYASHAVLVSGLVSDPGTKILRREAVPLFVVVSEAQPKPEAGRAVVMSHSSGKMTNVDLNNAAAMGILVQQGDVINLVVLPPEFFYIGGEITSPGKKDFHTGMTLIQALMTSGGPTRFAGPRVKVSRQGSDGRLVSTEYGLKEIEDGVIPDPPVRAGDRIEVFRAKK